MKEAPKHLGCRVVDVALYLRCSDCNRLISPRDYAAGDETSGECAVRWKLLAEGLAGTVHAGHALYDSIVSRLTPHYPADSRDLDWDVLPSTLAALARGRDEASASLAAEVKRLRAEVATLHEGWQAERDAATRAHDLLIAEREAARLTLAAEQGGIEGAPSEHWTPIRAADGSLIAWHNKQTGAVVEAYIDRLSATDVRFAQWRWRTRSGRKGRADNARAAMLAADGCAP